MTAPISTSSASKQKVALVSLAASGGLSVLKFAAAFFTGSLALLTEAFHSLADFVATFLTYFAVRLGDKPADDDHTYGHAKIESLAALAETVMLAGLASVIAYEAIARLWAGSSDVHFSWWAIAVLIVSIIVDYNRSRALQQAATEHGSAALAADAVHFSADMWSSAAVIAGLIAVYLGYTWVDSAVALVVAGMIARAAMTLGWTTVNALLDRAPDGLASAVRDIVRDEAGVLAMGELRAKPVGNKLFVTLGVNVARTLHIDAIENIRRNLVAAVVARFPQADVTVTANAVAVDDESAFDKVYHIARKHALAIHHLTIQDIDGKLAVSFDLEVDGETPLAEAHVQATQLESEIRETLGQGVEVESHVEPLPPAMLHGQRASEAVLALVANELEAICLKRGVADLHNVRVRETAGELFVHFHCRFKPEVSVRAVHDAVDGIETELRKRLPRIGRVIAHAEPVGAPKHLL
jgi:cation diffusion facilitator family transporter